MWCTDLTKVNKHLDEMIEIQDSLQVQSIAINDDMFVNTIIASIPDTFQPTINALVVHSHTKEQLKPPKLIAAICAEALSYVKKSKQKKGAYINFCTTGSTLPTRGVRKGPKRINGSPDSNPDIIRAELSTSIEKKKR